MSNVTTITGFLTIQDTQLTDLQGLDNLTSVGGDVYIGGQLGNTVTTPLTSLNGLNSLATIGGELSIDNNTQLTDISALNNLTSIDGGELHIRHNLSLPTSAAEGLAIQAGLDPSDIYVEICGNKSGEKCATC